VSATLAYALLAAVAAIVLLLHLLKPRPVQVLIGSTLLWTRVAKHYRRRDRLWRWWLSLLLCLAAALTLAFAVTRAPLPAGLAAQTRLVVVLDNSPSMAARARDGKSRWLHAVEQARALIEGSSEIMLLDTMGDATLSAFVLRDEALAALERVRLHTFGTAQLPPLADDASHEVHFIGDGVAKLELPARATLHSVFEAADNVAVTALDARAFPADPLRYEAFVQVYNASAEPKSVRLSLRGNGGFSLSQELQMAAGELVEAVFDVTAFPGGVLAAAALTANDALALDDIAFAAVPAHRAKQILLVTRGNPRLQDALRSLPGVQLEVVSPAQYRDDMMAAALVFDQFAPAQAPQAGALLFHPPAVPWMPAAAREARGAAALEWDRDHVLTDGVDWRELSIQRASLTVRDSPAQQAIVSAAQGTLIGAGTANARWIRVGFALQESNLTLHPAFPVFLGNALSWLTGGEPATVAAIGTVHVPLPDAKVTNGSGAVVASRDEPGGTVFDAARPDVYTVRAAERRVEVVANLLDPRLADINDSQFRERPTAIPHLFDAAQRAAQPWILFLLIAAALLLVEWAAYTRRLTV